MPEPDSETLLNEDSPLNVLIDAGIAAQRCIEKALLPLRLSGPQQRILTLVQVSSQRLTPSMLAALLIQETHSVSGLLNRLEDRGLIDRTRDRRDRRVVWVSLTKEGERVMEEATRLTMEIAKNLQSAIPANRQAETVAFIRAARDRGSELSGAKESVRREAVKRVWG